jgi:hypothetical protein
MYSSCSFSTSALDGDEWSALRPGRGLPPRKDPGTHCTGGWVAPEPVWTQRKNPLLLPGIEPRSHGRPARSQTLYCLSYPGFTLTVVLDVFIIYIIIASDMLWFLYYILRTKLPPAVAMLFSFLKVLQRKLQVFSLICHYSTHQRFAVSSRPSATFAISYRLAGRKVINENLLKRHDSLLKMTLTYYYQHIHTLHKTFHSTHLSFTILHYRKPWSSV